MKVTTLNFNATFKGTTLFKFSISFDNFHILPPTGSSAAYVHFSALPT